MKCKYGVQNIISYFEIQLKKFNIRAIIVNGKPRSLDN